VSGFESGQRDGFTPCFQLGLPYLVRVVLHPSWLWIVLVEFVLRHA
jgi:hypothetical protein